MPQIVEVRTSKIDGLGCFAGVDLLPGTMLPVPHAKSKWATKHTLETPSGTHRLFSPYCYLNHADEPNAEIFEAEEGGLFLEIQKIIKAKEEIVIDYGEEYRQFLAEIPF